MRRLLLLLCFLPLLTSQLDCGWLSSTDKTYTSSLTKATISYNGGCCSQEAIDYMKTVNPIPTIHFNNWRKAVDYNKYDIVYYLFKEFGDECSNLQTTTKAPTTTTKPTTKASTTSTKTLITSGTPITLDTILSSGTSAGTIVSTTAPTSEPVTFDSTTPINCGWLNQPTPTTYSAGSKFTTVYSGECCDSNTTDFLDNWNKSWTGFVERSDRAEALKVAYEAYICMLENVTDLDCGWLAENVTCGTEDTTVGGQCCTDSAVMYLTEFYQWRTEKDLEWRCMYTGILWSNRNACISNPWGECGWLEQKRDLSAWNITDWYMGECCSKTGMDWMNRNVKDWRNSTNFEQQSGWVVEMLEEVGSCQDATTDETTTSTSAIESTTSSSKFDCNWLSVPYNYTTPSYPFTVFKYNGTCCTETAVNALSTSYQWSWTLNEKQAVNQWSVLSQFLFCIEGACTEPELWTNCSASSTSSTTGSTTTAVSSTSDSSSTSESLTSTSDSTDTTTTTSDSTSESSATSSVTPSSTSSESESTTSSEKVTWRGKSTTTLDSTTSDVTSESSESSESTTTNENTSSGTSESSPSSSSSTSDSSSESTTSSGTTGTTSESMTSETSASSTSDTTITTGSSESTTSEASSSSESTSSESSTSGTSSTSSDGSSESTETSEFTTTSSNSSSISSTASTGSTGSSTSGTSTKRTTSETSESTTSSGTSSGTSSTESTSLSSTSSGTSSGSTASSGASSTSSGTPTSTSTSNGTSTSGSTSTGSTSSGSTSSSSTASGSTSSSSSSPKTTSTVTQTTTNVDGVYFRNTTVQSFANCTQITIDLLFFINGTVLRNTTVDNNACLTSTTTGTTTYPWATGGTTKKLPNGEIIMNESLIAYQNCTTVLRQLIWNPTTNETRTEVTTDPEGCKATSSSSLGSTATSTQMTSSKTSSTSTSTQPTTTFNWPTGGTTRKLPSGEIIISESLVAYPNCTTVLMQLIWNPTTNATRTEVTSDAEGCKATSPTTTKLPGTSTTATSLATTSQATVQTTTFNWPTGGTTKKLPSGEIIISESLVAYPNCTTVLMQLIWNPTTNATRTEVTSDAEGCKATSTTIMSSGASGSTTTPMRTPPTTTQATTTYPWPTGGTTKKLPSGEIIISESLIAYPNCTTVLMQLIWNPTTNVTRTEVTSDAEGCKATTASSLTSGATSGSGATTEATIQTTTFNWPTGGTTKKLPSGEIIISESLIAYPNCTTVLMQLIWNPTTNATRTEVTSDAEGCKATSPTTTNGASTTPMSGSTTTMTPETTTFNWPTGGTTKKLPSGEIIISESLIAYPNCTTVLMQLIWNPTTNATRTEVTSDSEGCKATSTTAIAFGASSSGISASTGAGVTTVGSTTGGSGSSESAESAGSSEATTPSTTPSPVSTTTQSSAQLTTTTSSPLPSTTAGPKIMCPFPAINLDHTTRPNKEEQKKKYWDVGEKLVHLCERRYAFEVAKQPYKVYTCLPNGKWYNQYEKCVVDKVAPRPKREL